MIRSFIANILLCIFFIVPVYSQSIIDTSTIDFNNPEPGQFIRTYPRQFMDTDNRFIADYFYDSIYAILLQLPDCTIEIGAHTDSRGTLQRNFTISQKRARLFANYLISICAFPADRLVPKGYGETALLNQCIDNIECTEAEYKINVRLEFKILEVKKGK